MRAVVQRVTSASVEVDGSDIARIDKGLLVLVGVAVDDTERDARWLAEKLVGLRVFPDERARMERSIAESGGEVLLVSQFTLLGDARKGRRPSFVRAAAGAGAEALYEAVAEGVRAGGVRCRTGAFGALMQVALVNDGPVTILLDSHKAF